MCAGQIGDGEQFGACEDLAERVGGGVENQEPGARRESGSQLVQVEGPAGGAGGVGWAVAQRHVDGVAAGHQDGSGVAVVEGFDEEDLVAGVDQRLDGGKDAFGCADCDEDLAQRVECAAEERAVGLAQRLDQVGVAGAAGILVEVSGDGVAAGFFDEVGGGEIGEALAKVHGAGGVGQGGEFGKNGGAKAAHTCGGRLVWSGVLRFRV